jgi:hypothetical protein
MTSSRSINASPIATPRSTATLELKYVDGTEARLDTILRQNHQLYFKPHDSVQGTRVDKGMPMALNAKAAWILAATLLITAASTLAGCASTTLGDSRSAEKARTSKDIDGSISESRPNANVCHVLRNALVDLNDAGISVNYFLLFGLPVFIRTAN